jgi:hypothetical protein
MASRLDDMKRERKPFGSHKPANGPHDKPAPFCPVVFMEQ